MKLLSAGREARGAWRQVHSAGRRPEPMEYETLGLVLNSPGGFDRHKKKGTSCHFVIKKKHRLDFPGKENSNPKKRSIVTTPGKGSNAFLVEDC